MSAYSTWLLRDTVFRCYPARTVNMASLVLLFVSILLFYIFAVCMVVFAEDINTVQQRTDL